MHFKPLDLHHDAMTLDTPDAEMVSRFQSPWNPEIQSEWGPQGT